jgi:hypothetical protein
MASRFTGRLFVVERAAILLTSGEMSMMLGPLFDFEHKKPVTSKKTQISQGRLADAKRPVALSY